MTSETEAPDQHADIPSCANLPTSWDDIAILSGPYVSLSKPCNIFASGSYLVAEIDGRSLPRSHDRASMLEIMYEGASLKVVDWPLKLRLSSTAVFVRLAGHI